MVSRSIPYPVRSPYHSIKTPVVVSIGMAFAFLIAGSQSVYSVMVLFLLT